MNATLDHNCKLGSGAYGVVYKGMCKGQIVAVKTVNPHATKEYYQSLLGEIKILSHIGRHHCIVNLEGAYTKDLHKGMFYLLLFSCEKIYKIIHIFKTSLSKWLIFEPLGTLYVFTEYCGVGNLEKFLRKNRNKYLTWEEVSLRNVDDELKFDDADTDFS